MWASWRHPWEAPWPRGAVLERYWALLDHLGNHIEASSDILSHLGGRLGLPEAILEPYWAIVDARIGRGTPRPGPGAGGRPRRRRGEDGRRTALNHLIPLRLLSSSLSVLHLPVLVDPPPRPSPSSLPHRPSV
eukprot:3023300-Pyramimonas_sp.AAC.1